MAFAFLIRSKFVLYVTNATVITYYRSSMWDLNYIALESIYSLKSDWTEITPTENFVNKV